MFVLYHPRTRPTGKLIARGLGLPFGIIPPRGESLIRWGSGRGWKGDRNREEVLNPAWAIKNASNKYLSFLRMQEQGIPLPFFTLDPLEAVDWRSGDGILFGRTLTGARGRDITVYLPDDPISTEHELYTGFIPNEREYRIHVVGGEVIRYQRKYIDHPEDDDTGGMIRTHSRGYRFRKPGRELNSSRLDLACSAVEAVGLDFGCADIVIGEDGEAYVLEVNSAPSCSPLTVSAYVSALRRMI